jgi:hypothetical protein
MWFSLNALNTRAPALRQEIGGRATGRVAIMSRPPGVGLVT